MAATRWRAFVAAALGIAALAGFEAGSTRAEEKPATAQALPAPAVTRLTLGEARQRALANNKALALARLNVEAAQHGTAAARKDYFPKVMGSVTYFHFDQDLGQVVTIRRGGGRFGIIPPTTRIINVAVINQD